MITNIVGIIITHIHDNHIKFEVSLHFWQIWPTVWRAVIQYPLNKQLRRVIYKCTQVCRYHLLYCLYLVMSGRKKRQKELEGIISKWYSSTYSKIFSLSLLSFGMWSNNCKYLLAISKKPQAMTNEVGNWFSTYVITFCVAWWSKGQKANRAM